MKKKLYEIVSAKKGASFEIKGVTLTLNRFSLEQAYELEKKGISLEGLDKIMEDKPVESITEVCYSLLDAESKAEVNNSIETFRQCLEMGNLESLMKALVETVSEGQPKAKK